jgi:tRNA dimethylallyltransferase
MNMVALIAGPTASGKSALALALAEKANGVIINADSAQIYRDLPILSAAPSTEESARTEHRLYGVRGAADPCSAAEWAELAKAEIAEVQASGRLPVLVGGTGLYLRTLLEGIAPIPPIDPAVRRRIREADLNANLTALQEADPEAALRLNPNDRTRIARALEVVRSTGQKLADWQSRREGGIGGDISLSPLILLPPRPWLYERCDRRFETMVDSGAIEEVQALLERKVDSSLPVMRAIGVREIAAFLAGEIDREEMIARGSQATRNYAKRQYTWFAHQPPADWPRLMRPLDESTLREALALLEPKT